MRGISAVAAKEFWALVRQPNLLLLLLVGPVLSMTIFGLSLDVENGIKTRTSQYAAPPQDADMGGGGSRSLGPRSV